MGSQVRILDSLTPFKKKPLPLPSDFSYLSPFLDRNPFMFKKYYRFGLPLKKIIEAVQAFKPHIVGIASQFTAYYKSVSEVAVAIKDTCGVPVIIGGNHASVFSQAIRKRTPQIDFVLAGPAEKSIAAFNFSYSKRTVAETEAFDWKAFMPAHELVEAGCYKSGRKNYVSLTASRGCPYFCEFCSVHTLFGRRIKYRDVETVLTEMRWNYEHKDVRIFNFEDDNLSSDTHWFTRFLKAIIDDPVLRQIELTAMNGICYPTLNEDLVVLMRRAGFKQINLAFVTRDADLRQKYQRPGPSRDLEKIIAAAKRQGFFVTVYVIIGLPEQTYAEIKGSIDYLLGLDVLVGPSVFYLPPGSVLYDRIEVPGDVLDNWNLYRSSAFAVETPHLNRGSLIELFSYVRKRNLENRGR
jgi:radical SAM superfamily enzyme YgiQ (UPF0313 family)